MPVILTKVIDTVYRMRNDVYKEFGEVRVTLNCDKTRNNELVMKRQKAINIFLKIILPILNDMYTLSDC